GSSSMTDSTGRISMENLERIYPLLPSQEGMLFHRLYDERSEAYFQQLSYRILDAFDPALCECTWNALLERHELLRSAVLFRDARQPLQAVGKFRRVEFHVEDLSGLDSTSQSCRLDELRRQDRRRGFDFESDCLIRVLVCRLGTGEHEMVWSFPHLLLDGWS